MFQLASFYSISFFEVFLLPFSVLSSDLFLLLLTFELLLILSDTLLFGLFCLLPLLLLSFLGMRILYSLFNYSNEIFIPAPPIKIFEKKEDND